MNSLDEALKEIATYKYGQSRKSLIAVLDYVRDSHGNSEARKELRKQLTSLLGSDATTDCKRFVCKQLSIVGTAQEVPALARLLTNEHLSHMARFALERIPDSAADGALCDALGKAKGKILVGIINSIGERRNRQFAKVVGGLIEFISDRDETVAEAAVAALGKIGTPEAAKALAKAKAKVSRKLRPVVDDALLQCAERLLKEGKKNDAASIYKALSAPAETKHVRAAARRGLETARRK